MIQLTYSIVPPQNKNFWVDQENILNYAIFLFGAPYQLWINQQVEPGIHSHVFKDIYANYIMHQIPGILAMVTEETNEHK